MPLPFPRWSSMLFGLLLTACAVSRPEPVVTDRPTAAELTVGGDLPRPAVFTVADLAVLGAEQVLFQARDGSHRYDGLRLDRLLAHCGFEAGPGGVDRAPADRHPGWRAVVVATAADGYQALFTCAELMPELGATRTYVVWQVDGQPLPADEGPLRLVVTTDGKRSRSARAVRRLEVLNLRGVLAAAR